MTRESDKHFEQFHDHTLVKHFLLAAYLKRWAIILRKRFPRVWFVDAFAGAGRDEAGNPGSPVIAARIAQAVNASIDGGATKDRGMHVIAIEWHDGRYQTLEQQLLPWTSLKPTYVYARHGVLETYIDRIMKHAGSDPVLFFLDPFGLKGLSAETYKKALAQPHNEIFVLFNDEGGVRLHGKATADPDSAYDVVRAVLESPGLFEELEADRIAGAELQAKRAAAGHKSNPQAKEIMDRAFGGDYWLERMRKTPEDKRQDALRILFEDLLLRSGAPFIRPFSIDTADDRHKYFLIHASKHKRAFTAMKDAIDRTRREQNKERDPAIVGVESRMQPTDLDVVGDNLKKYFAGQLVRWSDKENLSVQDYAYEATPIWNHELPLLKQMLIGRGWGEKIDRKQYFRFPAND